MQQLKHDKLQSTIKTENGSKSGIFVLCNKAVRPMQRLIKDMSNEGTIIVASAGNFGWPAGFTLPGKRYFPEVLIVGAMRKLPHGAQLGVGSFNIFTSVTQKSYKDIEGTQFHQTRCLKVGSIEGNVDMQALADYNSVRQVGASPGVFWKTMLVGSNYGNASDVDIWAPGANLLALGPQHLGTSYWIWEDTSAAAPVVAGTVALIKALRPDIRSQEVRQLLRRTATHSQDDTGLERGLPFPDLSLKVQEPNDPTKDSNATKCGITQIGQDEYYNNCGTLQPTSTSIYTLNALKALEQLPGISPSENKAKVYYGQITPMGGGDFYLDQKNNHSNALLFPLSPGDHEPGSFFSEDENFIDGFEDFLNNSPLRGDSDVNTVYRPCSAWPSLDMCKQYMENWFSTAYPPARRALYDTLTYNLPDRYIKVVGWPTPLGIRVLSLSVLNEEDVPEEERLYSGGVGPSSDPSGYPSADPSGGPLEEPTPTPIPSFEPAPDFSAPVVVSQVAGAGNTKAPYRSNLRSVLKEGPFGSYNDRNEVNFLQHGPVPAAQWIGFLDPHQTIRQSYPKVPNTNKLNRSNEAFKLRILVQVKNQGQGGTLVVEAGGNERRENFGPGTAYENAELRPIRFDFFDSAREGSGGLVKIHLIGGVENAQIIYKMFAVPYED